MENLTSGVNNQSEVECTLCLHSPVFLPIVLSYIVTFLPANCWVMWLMKSSPIFWTDKMEVSEFHLVLTELLFGLLGLPTILLSFSVPGMIKTATNIINILFAARIQFQCSVCMERYVAVVHPVYFLGFKPLRYRMTFCCVVWLQSILFGIVQILFCIDKPGVIYVYTLLFFVVFFLDSFFCLSVLWVLKQPSPGKKETEGSKKIKRRAFNIVLMFQVTTLVGCVPLFIMLFLMKRVNVSVYCVLQPLAYALVVWLGAIYPLHYLHRSGKILVSNEGKIQSKKG